MLKDLRWLVGITLKDRDERGVSSPIFMNSLSLFLLSFRMLPNRTRSLFEEILRPMDSEEVNYEYERVVIKKEDIFFFVVFFLVLVGTVRTKDIFFPPSFFFVYR